MSAHNKNGRWFSTTCAAIAFVAQFGLLLTRSSWGLYLAGAMTTLFLLFTWSAWDAWNEHGRSQRIEPPRRDE